MSLLEWTKQLDIGVPAMNTEHMKLLEIMNRLYDRNEAKCEVPELRALLTELGAYTIKHFSDEEAYLATIEYPELAIHKLIHKDLLEKFGRHVTDFDVRGILDPAFFGFLKLWLSAHIQGVDMKYGAFSKTIS